MRASLPLAAATLLSLSPVGAQAPDGPLRIGGSATLASDYRFRGLSQSDRRIAGEATLTIDHASGLYVEADAASIRDYAAAGADAQVDLLAGYAKTLSGARLDGGIAYRWYPGGNAPTDFFEPYLTLSYTLGPVRASVGGNVAWKQRGLELGTRRRGGTYLHGDLSAAIPATPLTLTAHVGHAFDRNRLTFGQDYSDWSLGAAWRWHIVTLSLAYVDTDTSVRSLFPGAGREIGGAGAVGSIGVSF